MMSSLSLVAVFLLTSFSLGLTINQTVEDLNPFILYQPPEKWHTYNDSSCSGGTYTIGHDSCVNATIQCNCKSLDNPNKILVSSYYTNQGYHSTTRRLCGPIPSSQKYLLTVMNPRWWTFKTTASRQTATQCLPAPVQESSLATSAHRISFIQSSSVVRLKTHTPSWIHLCELAYDIPKNDLR